MSSMDNNPTDSMSSRLKLYAEKFNGKSKVTQILLSPKGLPKLYVIFKTRREALGEKSIEQFCEELIEGIEQRMRRAQTLNASFLAQEEALIGKIFKSFEKDNFKSFDTYISHLVLKKSLDSFVETLPKDPEEYGKRLREGMEAIARSESKTEIVHKLLRVFEFGKHDPNDFAFFDEIDHQKDSAVVPEGLETNLMKRVKLYSKDHGEFREFLDHELSGLGETKSLEYVFFDNRCQITVKDLRFGHEVKLTVDFHMSKIFIESPDPDISEKLAYKLYPNYSIKENLVNIIEHWKMIDKNGLPELKTD